MFLLKIFRNLIPVMTFVSAVFFVMLQSVQTQQVLIRACSADFEVKIRCTCRRNTWPFLSPLYDAIAVSVCVCLFVRVCIRVRDLKDTCPLWDGKEPCALRALELMLWQVSLSAVPSSVATYTGQGHNVYCPLQCSVTSPVIGCVTCQSQLSNVLSSAQAKGTASCGDN